MPQRPPVCRSLGGESAASPGVRCVRRRGASTAAPLVPRQGRAAPTRSGEHDPVDGAPDPSSHAAPDAVTDALYSLGHHLLEGARMSDAADFFRVLLLLSPDDERGWLALAECHDRADQPCIALELYSAGAVVAAPSARCQLGRARVLRALGRECEADQAAQLAVGLAELADDLPLLELALAEARSP